MANKVIEDSSSAIALQITGVYRGTVITEDIVCWIIMKKIDGVSHFLCIIVVN